MRLTSPLAASIAAAALALLLAAPAKAASTCAQAATAAQDLQGAGRLREARAQLLVCVQKNCNSVVRADCEKWLKEVDEQTPSIIVRPVDAHGREVLNARVTIDDAPIELNGTPFQVDPGQRLIKARMKSGEVAEQKTLVAQGEKSRVIEVRFATDLAPDGAKASSEPTPVKPTGPDASAVETKSPSNVVPITLAVVGGIALASFAYFELSGQSDYSDLQSTCKGTAAGCSDEQVSPVRQKFVAAGISLGISVVALGAAAIVYFTRKSPSVAFRPFSPVIRF